MLQKELAKRLKARYDTKMDGNEWLEVSSDGIPLCRIKYNGQFLSNADQNLSDEYRSKIADIQDEISTVREYVGLYEHAPQMKAADVSDYRQLAAFGDTVLAATYSEKNGFMFCTWKQNADGDSVFWGDYSPNYGYVKEAFAVRSGLVNKQRLFSENESAYLCRCVDFAKGNCETLTYEQERQLDNLREKLTDGYPSLEAEPPTFEQVSPPQQNTLAIAKILNEDGIPRKHGYEKWLPSSINYVLNNERYMGDALLQKSYTTETLPFRKMKNDGRLPQYYVENSNPAIVSRETFQAAQNLLRSRKTERCKRKSYPLTGKLRCPECGRVFRHQVVNGKAHWICSCRSSGATDCQHRHVREDIVYEIFTDMVIKLKTYRGELLGTLIHQMETMQDRTSRNQERIRQIDKEIADLGAKNHIIARLHTSGAMNAADYAMQTSEIGNRLTELRIERRQKLTEDEDDQLLATLKDLNGILDEYEPTVEFDNGLFDEIVESITVDSSEQLTFKLIGGITLTEQIPKKGR